MAAKKDTTGRTRRPQLAAAQLQLLQNRAGFDAYEQARLALKRDGLSATAQRKLRATMEKHRPAFTAYWRAYNDPRTRAQRDRARAAKAAAAKAA